MECSDFNIKKFIFSQKNAFVVFRETETWKKSPYILEKGIF